ncbi:MAG: hypothetical protein KME23_07805 [Goleter apudmare HA4340-LM2]|jgi:hypothetical protein|nr:hypothetical protein [Goleter apudmare HA4340-LM2]
MQEYDDEGNAEFMPPVRDVSNAVVSLCLKVAITLLYWRAAKVHDDKMESGDGGACYSYKMVWQTYS